MDRTSFILVSALALGASPAFAQTNDALPLPKAPATTTTATATQPRVVIVRIDPATIEKYGPFGGSYRPLDAQLIQKLDAAGVAGIGMDISFPENPSQVAGTEAIARAAAASRAPVVVTVAPNPDGTLEPNAAPIRGNPRIGEGTALVRPELVLDGGIDAAQRAFDEARKTGKKPEISFHSGQIGLDAQGQDGFSPLFKALGERMGVFDERDVASIEDLETTSVEAENGKVMVGTDFVIRPRLGEPSEIPTVSFASVLDGTADPKLLQGAIVFVGMDDGVHDVFPNPDPSRPDLKQISGVYFHAFVMKQALEAHARLAAAGAEASGSSATPPTAESAGLIKKLPD
jgi:CHASE2 domain-containing sensor protein